MKIDKNKIAQQSEKNQNFSNLQVADVKSNTIIEMTDDEKIDYVAVRILNKYRKAFEELAK